MQNNNALFSDKYLTNQFITLQFNSYEQYEEKLTIIKKWQASIANNAVIYDKEESLQADFLHEFFVNILEYSKSRDTGHWTLRLEQKTSLDSKKMDAALGYFAINNKEITADVRVVIELKDARTDLDKPQTRKNDNRTPVQQAFDYANSVGGSCRWIIVSNFKEIRLYYQTDRTRYQRFLITELDQPNNFKHFYFLLHKSRLISKQDDSHTDKLYFERQAQEQEISKQFYKTYKTARKDFFEGLKALNPKQEPLVLLAKTQKLLDRLLFIHFCEDSRIIPPYTLKDLIKTTNAAKFDCDKAKLYRNLRCLFSAINNGYPEENINKFNGGLFADDVLLNQLRIDDDLINVILKIIDYDFASDLNVNILGHIFEQSISDLEKLRAGENKFDEKQSKRKKDGIYYTPDNITRYIVEQAIGGWLKDRRAELAQLYSDETELLQNYWQILTHIKVLDPACGSGAFLNQAFDFLNEEMELITEQLMALGVNIQVDNNRHILENNLFGVDLNAESVSITKLSLWLKTANNNKELGSLDHAIKCGNSLCDDKTIAGDKAFVWQEEFKAIMANGGFDVIIGNPPYIKEYTNKAVFEGLRDSPYYQGKMDLWYFFVCYGLDLLKKDSGILAFIATNNWTTNSGASKLRNKIIENATIKQLVDFGSYIIFESADVQTMIMTFSNRTPLENYSFEYRKIKTDKPSFDDVNDILQGKQTKNNEIIYPVITQNLMNKALTFSDNNVDSILEKIKLKANFFLDKKTDVANGIHSHHDYVSKVAQKILGNKFKTGQGIEVGQGIVFPQDYANKNSQKILGSSFKVGQGIFVLSDVEKQTLNLNAQELALIKPYYTTQQLSRWFVNANNSEWIIYTDSSFNKADAIEPYPNIKKHLDRFQSVITSDNKPYGLHRARKENFFKGEKIIVLRKCVNQPSFTYTDFDCYVSATFYIIKSERIHLKYLTAILNSKLIAFWLKHKGKMQGNNYQLDKEPLLALPLYQIDETQQQPFIDKADIMLEQNKTLQKRKSEFLDFLQASFSIKKLSIKLQNYEQLTWAEFQAELSKIKLNLIALSPKGVDLESVWFKRFEDSKTQVLAIKTIIEQTDKDIDALVYKLYGLNADDIALIEYV